jgi:hypothetical protein
MAKQPDDDKKAGEEFRRFEEFTRRLLQVPKKEIDRRLAEERAAREKRRRVKAQTGRTRSRSRP